MKILIIGSRGFIGSHAYQFFLKQHEVWGADVVTPRDKNFFLLERMNTDFNAVFKSEQFDLCLNASGNGSVPVSIQNPLLDFELNVNNTIKILDAIRTYNPKCKYIHLSSAAVYGNPVSLPVTESMALKPLSPYGWHKMYSEQICREYFSLYNIGSVILRIFSVYGENLKKQLFWDIYQKTLQSKNIQLFGTGHETRDFIYVQDLMHAINCIIDKGSFKAEAINVSSGIETSIKEAAEIFCAALNNKTIVAFNKQTKLGDPLNWKADISLLSNMGFKSNTSIETGLNSTSKWLKENL